MKMGYITLALGVVFLALGYKIISEVEVGGRSNFLRSIELGCGIKAGLFGVVLLLLGIFSCIFEGVLIEMRDKQRTNGVVEG